MGEIGRVGREKELSEGEGWMSHCGKKVFEEVGGYIALLHGVI